jgi:glucosylceramidase
MANRSHVLIPVLVSLGLALLAVACAKSNQAPNGPSCPDAQMVCGQECLSVLTDPMNCGGCGIPCSTGQICQEGACQCVSGTLASGACVSSNDGGAGTIVVPEMLVTSSPGVYWNTDGLLTDAADAKADVTVDDLSTAQTWEGFGGSFNEMGWNVLSMLSPSDRDMAIRLLYGDDGARFTFGRIPIGASDYAMDRYTLDETPGDTSLADFSIARDTQALIPFIKAAQAVKANIRFWASPWTPPTWMKLGPFSPGDAVSAFDGGKMKDDDATMQSFAQYLVDFVQAYAQQGISIETISPQNEPSYTGNYPTCGWSPATYTKLVGQYLGPAVASAGLATKIMLGTFNGGDSDPAIVSSVMADVTARGYIKVLGFQWGMQSRVRRARSYNLPIWQTEHKCGNYPWAKPFDANRAPNDQAYAVESWGLIRDWIKAGVTAYRAWNMVLDTVGVGIDTTRVWPQDALLTVDTSTKTLNITPTYYVFRHFSQFVATGARVIATSGGDSVAFKNPDGSIVVVMYNAGAARTLTVAIAGKKLQLAMPGQGWATVVSR